MNQKLAKSPRSFEDNLLVLLGTLRMQWQKPVCFISEDNTNGFKNCHMKVENCSLIYLFLSYTFVKFLVCILSEYSLILTHK